MAVILQSVGLRAANVKSDVEIVQALLNKAIAKLAPMRPLRVDGQVGPKTLAAIEAFQSRVLGMAPPDGRVDPGAKTIKALTKATPSAETRSRVPLGARQLEKPTTRQNT